MNIIKNLITPTIILLILDSFYIIFNKKMFENQIIQIQKTSMQIRYSSVIACYIFLISGLWYFIIRTHKHPIDAFFLGILIYGVYETTTYATFKNWNLKLVLLDTSWGGVLLGLTTFLTYKINSLL
jgi:uncharacterized membrane protein